MTSFQTGKKWKEAGKITSTKLLEKRYSKTEYIEK